MAELVDYIIMIRYHWKNDDSAALRH